MIKMQDHIKQQMIKDNQESKTFFLKDVPDDIQTKAQQGFIFSFENWGMDCDRSKLEYLPYAQYALIDEIFDKYVISIENDGEWTATQLNDYQEVNECFHEFLSELDFYRLKGNEVQTLDELIPILKDISFFPPEVVIKDGKLINIHEVRSNFDNVVYF